MFGYMSIAELAAEIRAKLSLIPNDVDLIVGIPRSGMIPAYMIGLFLNRLVVDLETFLADGRAGHGATRQVGAELHSPLSAAHILLVDDSLASGASLSRCIERIAGSPFRGRMTTCAVIVDPGMSHRVDLHFRQMPQPRIFEWNAFHHPYLEEACVDLDGVLCVDPTPRENDDGVRYCRFMSSTRPLFNPTRRIGHIVSARLEKYRDHTENWLRANAIEYGRLHLLDLPSKAERQRLGAHHAHKAGIYRDSRAILFYESDASQAPEIARLSGKPVLCITTMELHHPSGFQIRANVKRAKWHLRGRLGQLKARFAERPPWGARQRSTPR